MFSTQFTVVKKILIQKTLNEVKAHLEDFNTWKAWSPWLCQEKQCPVSIEGTPGTKGHKQTWEGLWIGQGTMILIEVLDHQLNYDLQFIKPFKSRAQVSFTFHTTPEGTEITWTMQGSLPIFFFFLKNMTKALVGNDYERGLLMLKDYLETGEVHSDIEIKGVVKNPSYFYLGIRQQSSTTQMPEIMTEDFKKLQAQVSAGKLPKPDIYLSLYHTFNLSKEQCDFTSCLGYTSEPQAVSGLSSGRITKHKAIQVVHTGPYRFLGNAWAAAENFRRFKKLKPTVPTPPFEVYLNSPMEVSENELKTEVNIPIKQRIPDTSQS